MKSGAAYNSVGVCWTATAKAWNIGLGSLILCPVIKFIKIYVISRLRIKISRFFYLSLVIHTTISTLSEAQMQQIGS